MISPPKILNLLLFKGFLLIEQVIDPDLEREYERISQSFEICQALHQKSGIRFYLFNADFFGQPGVAFDCPQYDQCCSGS